MLQCCATVLLTLKTRVLQNYELVVVDDGSADETPILLEKSKSG